MPEQITAEEMKAGTQPTRLEKLMFTPLEEVLAKETWDDIDVEILVANRSSLPEDVLAKLGIVKLVPRTEAEVMAQNAELMKDVPPEVPEQADGVTVSNEATDVPVGETVTETATTESTPAPETQTETVDNTTSEQA